jgi:DNA-binding IscR family transcriptional regulator
MKLLTEGRYGTRVLLHSAVRCGEGPISLKDIAQRQVIPLFEGPIAPVECVNNAKTCPHSDLCGSRVTWGGVKEAMNGVLESTSLQDLVEPERPMGNVN